MRRDHDHAGLGRVGHGVIGDDLHAAAGPQRLRLLGDGGLPGVRPTDVTFASNQVRIRVPPDPLKAWQLTGAVVARLRAEPVMA